MFDALVPRILHLYGLESQKIFPLQEGYRSKCYRATLVDKREVNVVIYKAEPDILQTIQRANWLSNHAAKQNLPARRTISPRLIRLRYNNTLRYASIYSYLPGQPIPWESYSKKHIKLLGQALSDLHASWRAISNSRHQSPLIQTVLLDLLNKMTAYFRRPGVRLASKRKLQLQIPPAVLRRFSDTLALADHLPSNSQLHMDFVRGNILFRKHTSRSKSLLFIGDVELSGILDFEKTSYGNAVFDIARSLAFLLVDCPRYQPAKIKKYFLQSGYNKRGSQQFQQPVMSARTQSIDLLEEYISFFLIHDFYKFLKHNPYEALHQNHHFNQTRELLLERGMIQLT